MLAHVFERRIVHAFEADEQGAASALGEQLDILEVADRRERALANPVLLELRHPGEQIRRVSSINHHVVVDEQDQLAERLQLGKHVIRRAKARGGTIGRRDAAELAEVGAPPRGRGPRTPWSHRRASPNGVGMAARPRGCRQDPQDQLAQSAARAALVEEPRRRSTTSEMIIDPRSVWPPQGLAAVPPRCGAARSQACRAVSAIPL
jgi:hypothetical protein